MYDDAQYPDYISSTLRITIPITLVYNYETPCHLIDKADNLTIRTHIVLLSKNDLPS